MAQQDAPDWKPEYVPLICLPKIRPTPVPVPLQSPGSATVHSIVSPVIVPFRSPTPLIVTARMQPSCVTVAASPFEKRPHVFPQELR